MASEFESGYLVNNQGINHICYSTALLWHRKFSSLQTEDSVQCIVFSTVPSQNRRGRWHV